MYKGGGGGVKNKIFWKIGKKKVPVGPFSPPGRWTGNNSLFEDGPSTTNPGCLYGPVIYVSLVL